MPTPAQVYGHPRLDDVPVSGPTDPGILKADCWWRQNVLPAKPACVDCWGPIPNWAQTKGLLGEWGMLAAAGDPDIWASLTPAQQAWVTSTLVTLNNIIYQSTDTTCPTWGPSINQMAGCFQSYYNLAYGTSGVSKILRTDGVFDQDTLNGIITVTNIKKANFPTPYPAGAAKKTLSKGEMFGIAAAGATVLGAVAYVATHKKSRRRKR